MQRFTAWGSAVKGERGTEHDDFWAGPAKGVYEDKVAEQEEAFASLGRAAAKIDDALGKMAAGILIFWGALVQALVELVAGFIGACAAAATAVGAPVAVAIALGTVAAAFTAFGIGVAALTVFVGVMKNHAHQLQQEKALTSGWPQATTNPANWRPDPI